MATVEVVCFFTSMVGIFLFGIAPMSDDDMDILGSKEREIYFDTRDLAKTSPEMIHKGGLSWPGISQILMGNIFPPKGTVPMDPDFQSLTLAIGLSLGLIATVFAGLGAVLATKLKNENSGVDDDKLAISNSMHIVIIASLIGNMEMQSENPWTAFTGSVANLVALALTLGIMAFIATKIGALASARDEGK